MIAVREVRGRRALVHHERARGIRVARRRVAHRHAVAPGEVEHLPRIARRSEDVGCRDVQLAVLALADAQDVLPERQRLVADAELFRLEAIVRWLDAADVRLKGHASLASPEAPDLPLETAPPMEVSP